MKNISLGRYVPYNTVLHRIDPRVKLVLLLFLIVTVFLPIRLEGFILMSILTFALLIISKIRLKTFFKSLKPMWFMLLLLFVFNLFLMKTGKVLFTIGDFMVYEDAIIQSLNIFFRLSLMLAFTMVLTATTKPLDLTYAIEFYLSPLKKIRFPSHEIAMTISITLRFIPTLLDETNKIMNAQASRGVDYENGKLREKISAVVSLIIPLFVASFQHSDELANAMVARGYNPSNKRTRYRTFKIKMRDILCSAIVICCFVAIINIKKVAWF